MSLVGPKTPSRAAGPPQNSDRLVGQVDDARLPSPSFASWDSRYCERTGWQMIWSDAVTQARAIRQGATSALELTEEYLRRIERLDPLLRSYVTVDVDRATASARRADQFLRSHGADALPPFHGVPLSVKDVVDVEGMATTHSSKALADNVAGSDAPIVSRWRKAGFVILGKTNVPEFCTSMTSSELNGVCRNPWDTGRTPGGSSGGAAAALAAGLCAVSHGTDGAGSIRVPASFCGLVGMKPTRGLVTFGPEEGTQYFGTSVHGALTRSVRDAAGVLDILVGTDDPASRWSPCPARPYAAGLDAPLGPLRIAVTSTPPYGVTDEQCAAFTRAIGQTLEDLGHHVEWDTPAWNDILAAALGPMEVPGAAALVEADSYALLEPRNRPMVASLAALTVVAHRGGSTRYIGLRASSSPSGNDMTSWCHLPWGCCHLRWNGRPGIKSPMSTVQLSRGCLTSRNPSICRVNRPSAFRWPGATRVCQLGCRSPEDGRKNPCSSDLPVNSRLLSRGRTGTLRRSHRKEA